MKCVQVLLNGKPYCTAGHEAVADLAIQITYAPNADVGHLSVIGIFPKDILAPAPNDPWLQTEITLNDEVAVRIVDSDKPDVTTKVRAAKSESGNDVITLLCSFCDKSESEVLKLITGPGVYICNECIEKCAEIIRT